MSTHTAVVTTAARAPLSTILVPTLAPGPEEVRVRVDWTASTPLDLHQADGGLLVKHPQVLGDGIAGEVVEVGAQVRGLQVGDAVFGFQFRRQQEKAHQEFVTTDWFMLGKIPPGISPEAAVTVSNNLVTAFHTLTTDLSLPLPLPSFLPGSSNADIPTPKDSQTPILIWGGSSSSGQYFIQLLHHLGYQNLLTTASAPHHSLLRSLGAPHVFDYRAGDVTESILKAAGGYVPLIVDCIGSAAASMTPLSKIARSGSKVAILLPVIVRDATDMQAPEYSMDVQEAVHWEEGVKATGVRTHFYLENPFLKEHLQPTIIPALLASGSIRPNAFRIVEGATLVQRAQKALDTLRRKEVSGERLVWRVSEDGQK